VRFAIVFFWWHVWGRNLGILLAVLVQHLPDFCDCASEVDVQKRTFHYYQRMASGNIRRIVSCPF
jgi:hypothetical protein